MMWTAYGKLKLLHVEVNREVSLHYHGYFGSGNEHIIALLVYFTFMYVDICNTQQALTYCPDYVCLHKGKGSWHLEIGLITLECHSASDINT